MREALRLARKGEGRTSPNPMVGAVVLTAGGEVAGRGWHRGPGKPHAEALALEEAGARAKGGTLFVNLEPCVHYGRTPPCLNAVLEAGVSRVFCSTNDPDPRVAGAGIAALRRAGVEVFSGLLASEAKALNRAYFSHRSKDRPYVTLKIAASLDGRTSAADGSSRWITGEAARRDVHLLRSKVDAICVGVGTILTDDPALNVRGVRGGKDPLRVIVDPKARTPTAARVLGEGGPTLIFASPAASPQRLKALKDSGADVVTIPSEGTDLEILDVLEHLAQRSVLDLLLEGGPKLAGAFESARLIDRYIIYLAPKLLGGSVTGGVIEGWAADSVSDARPLRIASLRRFDRDLRIEAFPAEEAT